VGLLGVRVHLYGGRAGVWVRLRLAALEGVGLVGRHVRLAAAPARRVSAGELVGDRRRARRVLGARGRVLQELGEVAGRVVLRTREWAVPDPAAAFRILPADIDNRVDEGEDNCVAMLREGIKLVWVDERMSHSIQIKDLRAWRLLHQTRSSSWPMHSMGKNESGCGAERTDLLGSRYTEEGCRSSERWRMNCQLRWIQSVPSHTQRDISTHQSRRRREEARRESRTVPGQ
jgi:hypothetical protein